MMHGTLPLDAELLYSASDKELMFEMVATTEVHGGSK